MSAIPVITIDGPTASGKGTVARQVAQLLHFHYLDSGALYRLAALASIKRGIDPAAAAALAALAGHLDLAFRGEAVFLDGEDVTQAIRAEAVGNTASRIAVHPGLRAALLDRQRAFREPPGLVADGRDMGTVVFPDAPVKVFLVASVEARAQRRTKQLMENGIFANLPTLLRDLQERDRRDSERSASPLTPAPDAVVIDSSSLAVDEVVGAVLKAARARGIPESSRERPL